MILAPQPIFVLAELREVNAAFIDLLRSLDAADWSRPTVHADRSVKDLVAHLLDGSLRRVSAQRDGFVAAKPSAVDFPSQVAFVQKLNREWMNAAKRLSPRVLVGLVSRVDVELSELFESIDLEAPAPFGVAWAGQSASPNWFDVAHEYTEKWHHQQQIRDAVGRPGLTGRRHAHPVIDAFIRAAPHAYRDAEAPEGASVKVTVTGPAGGIWSVVREDEGWVLTVGATPEPIAEVVLNADIAWRLWTKGMTSTQARERMEVAGDEDYAEPLLRMTCVMA